MLNARRRNANVQMGMIDPTRATTSRHTCPICSLSAYDKAQRAQPATERIAASARLTSQIPGQSNVSARVSPSESCSIP